MSRTCRSTIYGLGLAFACGCSQSSTEPTANAPQDPHAAQVAAGAPQDAEAARVQGLPETEFAAQFAQLAAAVNDYRRRGYDEQAIASRIEMVDLLTARYGADAWETRSARVALDREARLLELDPNWVAVNKSAEQSERKAYEHWEKQQPREALVAIQNARGLTAKVWGESDYGFANLLDQEARWQDALGAANNAVPLFRQALSIREQVFSRAHPDTIATISGLAMSLQAAGQRDEAGKLLRECVELGRRVWGEQHLEFATQLANLAALEIELNQPAAAAKLLNQACDIRRQALGNSNLLVGQTVLTVGLAQYATQDYTPAEANFREALAMFNAQLGGKHRLTRLATVNLGLTLMAEKQYAEAESLLRTDLAVAQERFGDDSADYAEGLSRIAILYGNQGRYNEALPLITQSAKIHRETSGADHAFTKQADQVATMVRSRLAAGGAPQKQVADPISTTPADRGAVRTSFDAPTTR